MNGTSLISTPLGAASRALRLSVARWVGALLLAVSTLTTPALAESTEDSAQVVWRLLDYIAVDYEGAVSNGQVTSESEFAEMTEFADQIRTRIGELPQTAAQPSLIQKADALKSAIAGRSPQEKIAELAHDLTKELIAAYPFSLAPSKPPDVARGAALYQERCAVCHGTTGAGDGEGAKDMDPPPVAFTELDRARQRSLFGLYLVITQGLEGTAMAGFSDLSPDERWALAFHIGGLAYSKADAQRGEQLWKADGAARKAVPNLAALAETTPAQLERSVGQENARALTAFLRRHPEAVTPRGADVLNVAKSRLAESIAAFEAGNRRAASDLAVSAYLDGFEPLEPVLKAREAGLVTRIETAMGEFRAAINKGESPEKLRAQADHLSGLFDAAERALAPSDGGAFGSTFVSALTILLREGLEALLIVVAMIAFLQKAGRSEMVGYVHGGWVAALAAGGLTWFAATHLITISGASREITEGVGSLIAAAVLVSVGLWMHGKSRTEAWQRYVHEKMSRAMSRGSAWFLFLLAFGVVYREVFETILFYAALWSEGEGMAMLAGVATGAVLLAVAAWALLRYSRRLPIGRFFSLSSILIAILAVVLAGKGVAALQEAGMLDVQPLAWLPRVEILGIYPTWEGILSQAITVTVLAIGFWYTSRSAVASSKRPSRP